MSQETLFLVDGSSFIFRAYYALPPLTRPDGTPVGAVLGFTNMLIRLLNEMHAHKIAVVFDAGRHTFRNDLYPEYKANRGETPEDLIPQFPIVREACEAFDIPVVEQKGFEADDLIASYTKLARQQNIKTIIVSSDKDLMQLVDAQTLLYDHMKNSFINTERVIEKFGVAPEKLRYLLALAGDSSDNVPGVPGIGPKTAAQLIDAYGDLETLLSSTHKIKQEKRRTVLETHAQDARLSLDLVTLREDVPNLVDLGAFDLKTPQPEKILPFLRTQGFKTLENKIKHHTNEGNLDLWAKEEPEKKPASPNTSYACVTSQEQLDEWCKKIMRHGLCAIDTETTSLDPMQAKLVGISLATQPGEACYIPVGHTNPQSEDLLEKENNNNLEQLPLEGVLKKLKPILSNPSILKVGQNIKYDKHILSQNHIQISPFEDTMLLSYLISDGKHGLDTLAQKYLGHTMIAFKEVAGSGKKAITFDQVPLEQASKYAAEDADYTLRLYQILKPLLVKSGLCRLYNHIDKPMVDTLGAMENEGILVDPLFLKNLSKHLEEELAKLSEDIYKAAGQNFNIASPKQLGEILFDHLGLPHGKKSKTGAYSTSSDILEKLETDFPIVKTILHWRQLAKLKSTYADSLPENINAKTGRIHTSYAMAVTSTGRLSSSDPNLQNIPIRTPEGRRIREAFIPKPNHCFLSLDYSQIELRLLAHYANIPSLKQAFFDGIDIHALTASQVFQTPLEQITPDLRSRAKAINFGIIYGISAFGLGRQLSISNGEAKEYIQAYHQQYPGIQAYMDHMIQCARTQGYVETILGRRCYVPNIHTKNPSIRGFAERQAINAPLQGSNADIIKKAMIRIPQILIDHELGSKMLLQVHDELIFECPTEEADKTITILKPLMENIHPLAVPLKVDAGIGKNWSEAH